MTKGELIKALEGLDIEDYKDAIAEAEAFLKEKSDDTDTIR